MHIFVNELRRTSEHYVKSIPAEYTPERMICRVKQQIKTKSIYI